MNVLKEKFISSILNSRGNFSAKEKGSWIKRVQLNHEITFVKQLQPYKWNNTFPINLSSMIYNNTIESVSYRIIDRNICVSNSKIWNIA